MTRTFRHAAAILAVFLGLAAAAPLRAEKLGIVLMHGKQGSPERGIDRLAGQLESAGHVVARPAMCWSRTRIYDRVFLDCIAEIDAAVASLKVRGADAIVVAGQSLGGSAALAYGARHADLAGIIALAPAPAPGVARRPEIARDLARAKDMLASGRGDERGRFTDTNQGLITVETSARIFASFLDPDGGSNIVANAGQAKAPLLWVVGDQDASQQGRDFAFAKAPPNPLNRFVTVHAGHFDTPNAAVGPVLDWLQDLASARQKAAGR